MKNKPKRAVIRLNGMEVFEHVTMRVPGHDLIRISDRIFFLHMRKGSAKIYFKDDTKIVMEGEGLLLKYGNYLLEFLPNSRSSISDIITIHLYPEIIKDLYKNKFPVFLRKDAANQCVDPPLNVLEHNVVRNFVEGLLVYFEHPAMVDTDWIGLKLKEFIHFLTKTHYGPDLIQLLNEFYSASDISFKDLIESNILSNLTREELAELSNCSIASFNRKFRRIYDESPAKYIRKRRLELAAEMLLATTKDITSIAYDCGFTSISHFSTSFKALYGVSPSSYRVNNPDKIHSSCVVDFSIS